MNRTGINYLELKRSFQEQWKRGKCYKTTVSVEAG